MIDFLSAIRLLVESRGAAQSLAPARVFGPNQLNPCTTDENFLMAFAWLALACPG